MVDVQNNKVKNFKKISKISRGPDRPNPNGSIRIEI